MACPVFRRACRGQTFDIPDMTAEAPSNTTDIQTDAGLRLLLLALAITLVFHGGLLPMTHGRTYDAFIHMFFGDHYHRSWFDPWEPRWYTGFATTSYPPGTHMMQGALMYLMPLRAAFVVVQLGGLLLLVLGVYRFSLLWVAPRAAGYAAVAATLASSISETVHLFGQLPTIFSLGLFLNGLPYFYRWIVFGKLLNLGYAVAFSAATTAAHHVTTIFGGVLFVLPLAVQSLRAYGAFRPGAGRWSLLRFWRPFGRGLVLAVLMIAAVALIVFPYWYWSVTDPITQVPIPHGSRENYLVRRDLGLVFFLIPWGLALMILPYAFYKAATSSLWPLGLSLAVCFVLGTGGTTPVPRAILGGAFDILTLDRFTFWGSILILPFTGVMMDGLMHGRSRRSIRAVLGATGHRALVGGLFMAMSGLASFVAILTTIQPTQPDFIEPAPIVSFLEEDDHDRWRYLTLGFGDQFAYLSAQTRAQSVDGNYHSARRLPDLTRFSVERLENAKYLGVPGLGSLEQFVVNADQYHLKYIFSNDAFYDPLLHFNGWNRLNRLQNGVVVWEKPDVSPLPLYLPRRSVPVSHAVMWGVLPPAALLLAFLLLAADLAIRRPYPWPGFVVAPQAAFANAARIRRFLLVGTLFAAMSAGVAAGTAYQRWNTALTPEQVVESYFKDLDFRRFRDAHDRLDPEFRPAFDEMLFRWKWQGGLVNSYGKLEDLSLTVIDRQDALIDYAVTLHYLTSVTRIERQHSIRVVRRGDEWHVVPLDLPLVQTPVRLQRQEAVAWNVVGRRQPRPEADLYRDRLDRPRVAVSGVAVVRHDGRFSIIGQLSNLDADPAAVSVFGELQQDRVRLARKAAGKWGGHRLLPAESAGFRIDFDGVLSLKHAESLGQFDPEQFIPPEYPDKPDGGHVDARAIVAARNIYRQVALNDLRWTRRGTQLVLSGLAVNTGTETASVIRIAVLLYDAGGAPRWVEAGFVENNVYPGQSEPFRMTMPLAEQIDVIARIPDGQIEINGTAQDRGDPPGSAAGTLPLQGAGGYRAARIQVTAMTYEPLT